MPFSENYLRKQKQEAKTQHDTGYTTATTTTQTTTKRKRTMKGRAREKGKAKVSKKKGKDGRDDNENENNAAGGTEDSSTIPIGRAINKRERKEERRKQQQKGGGPKPKGRGNKNNVVSGSLASSTDGGLLQPSKPTKINGYMKRRLAKTQDGGVSNSEVIDQLPPEVWTHIASFIQNNEDLLNFRLTCQVYIQD